MRSKNQKSPVTSDQSPVASHQSAVKRLTGYWLLATGYWLLATLVWAQIESDGAWQFYRGDLQNTGVSAVPMTPPLALTWKFRPPTYGVRTHSALVSDGNYLYFAAGKKVYCLDPFSGHSLWNPPRTLRSTVDTAPALSDGILYVGTTSGEFVALDSSSGEVRWNYPARGKITTPVMVYDGKAYFCAGQTLHVLDLGREGKDPIQVPLTGGPVSAIALSDDNLCLTTNNHRLVILPQSLEQNVLVRDVLLGAEGAPTDPVVQGNMAFVGIGRQLLWFDLKANLIRFRVALDDFVSSPCLFKEVLFVGTKAGTVYAISARHRQNLWRMNLRRSIEPKEAKHPIEVPCVLTPLPQEATFEEASAEEPMQDEPEDSEQSPPSKPQTNKRAPARKGTVQDLIAALRGVIWLVTADGLLYALDASSGKVLWRYRLGDDDPASLTKEKVLPVKVSAPPLILRHGLFVLTEEGTVYAFSPTFPDFRPPFIENPKISIPTERGETLTRTLRDESTIKIPGRPPITISVTVRDEESGVDESTFEVKVTGKEQTGFSFEPSAGKLVVDVHRAEGRLHTPLANGQYVVSISVRDSFGNEATRQIKFQVDNTMPMPTTQREERQQTVRQQGVRGRRY